MNVSQILLLIHAVDGPPAVSETCIPPSVLSLTSSKNFWHLPTLFMFPEVLFSRFTPFLQPLALLFARPSVAVRICSGFAVFKSHTVWCTVYRSVVDFVIVIILFSILFQQDNFLEKLGLVSQERFAGKFAIFKHIVELSQAV